MSQFFRCLDTDESDPVAEDVGELVKAKARNATRHKRERQDAQRRSKRHARPPSGVEFDRVRRRLKPSHLQFVTELLKNPSNQGAAYSKVYPNASKNTAYRRANELINRPDVASEILRQQNLRTAKAQITRERLESALAAMFAFDFRRFFYSELEAQELGVKAGDPKKPHHLDDEAARVMESYERARGKYGDKTKFKTTGRLGAAELLAKLRGWLKDEGRPPVVANFQFNFGPKPASAEDMKPVEAVPEHLYGAMGLRDASIPAQPIPQAFDGHGDPVKSNLPPGYEPGRRLRNQ